MAVTGNGTEANPYVVQTYAELKKKCQTNVGVGKTYVTLGNDIDCNDYGADFEWETVQLGVNNSFYTVLDLGGHIIKNLKVKAANHVFEFLANGSSILKNGTVKNVFLNGAAGFVTGAIGQLINIAASIVATGCTGNVFGSSKNATYSANCGFYIESAQLNAALFSNFSLKNSDVVIKIAQQYGKDIVDDSCNFDGCRLRGKVAGSTIGINSGGYAYGYLFRSDSPFVSCVHDLDFKDSVGVSLGFGGYFRSMSRSSSVYCTDNWISSGTAPTSPWYWCTGEQLRDAEYLNNSGFPVVDVGA